MHVVANNSDVYDWGNYWKMWVPDPAKKYVGEAEPIKINPIFARGKQPLPQVESDLCTLLLPFHEPFSSIYEECIKPALQ